MKKIFFTYSDEQEDVNLYKELKLHFTPYAKKGIVKIIDKEELFRITNDKQKAKEILLESDIAIPLLSIDYINDDDCIALLETAADNKKIVIPVLLRECLWNEIDKLRPMGEKILPADKQPIREHIRNEGSEDKVLSGIALKVKAILLGSSLDEIPAKHETRKSGMFEYIIASIVLLMGALGAAYGHSKFGDWKITILIFLLFLTIALFALRTVLFPTKILK